MDNENSTLSYAVKYGSILGVIAFAYGLTLQWLELDTENWATSIVYLFLIATLVLAFNEYKKDNEGFLAYGQGVKLSALISLVFGGVSSVLGYIYFKFIDDSSLQRILEVTREKMEADPKLNDEQIEIAMSWTEKFTNPEVIAVMGIISYLLIGTFIGLVLSAIMKKTPEDSEVL